MTTLFVHGVPETAALWDRVRGLIDRESSALRLPGFGVPRPDGHDLVAAVDDVMVDSILRLYRSAIDVGTVWAADGPSPVPGLVLVAEGDVFGNVESSRRIAA